MTNITTEKNLSLDLSVLIPISERHDDIKDIFIQHHNVLKRKNLTHEFIFVLDGFFPDAEKQLNELQSSHADIVKVVKFNRNFGEAKALNAAFKQSTGRRILTLSAYFQVIPDELQKLLDSFTDDIDVAFGARYPRKDNFFNRIQSRIFHFLINYLTVESFQDISCGIRLMNREVLQKVSLYGDLHRFIPLLAIHSGFKVKEIPLQQASEDKSLRLHGPGVYLRRLLDILTLFFLIKFTQKPLRFFGLWGSGIGFIGVLITTVTIGERYFSDTSLADRPLFLVGILFIVLGIQTFFIGLVAEIILFMHKPSEPHYNIEEKVE